MTPKTKSVILTGVILAGLIGPGAAVAGHYVWQFQGINSGWVYVPDASDYSYVSGGSPGPQPNRPQQPSTTIHVSFRNGTPYRVPFHLNGGHGLDAVLNPGQTIDYRMLVNPGVSPVVGINQFNRPQRWFTVSDGGRYEFRLHGNEIGNFYRNY